MLRSYTAFRTISKPQPHGNDNSVYPTVHSTSKIDTDNHLHKLPLWSALYRDDAVKNILAKSQWMRTLGCNFSDD